MSTNPNDDNLTVKQLDPGFRSAPGSQVSDEMYRELASFHEMELSKLADRQRALLFRMHYKTQQATDTEDPHFEKEIGRLRLELQGITGDELTHQKWLKYARDRIITLNTKSDDEPGLTEGAETHEAKGSDTDSVITIYRKVESAHRAAHSSLTGRYDAIYSEIQNSQTGHDAKRPQLQQELAGLRSELGKISKDMLMHRQWMALARFRIESVSKGVKQADMPESSGWSVTKGTKDSDAGSEIGLGPVYDLNEGSEEELQVGDGSTGPSVLTQQ